MDNTALKLVLFDPDKDGSEVQKFYQQLKNIRIKTILIFTQKPMNWMLVMALNLFATNKFLNVIFAYEDMGDVVLITVNPFLSKARQNIKFVGNQNFFEEKARHLHGYKVKALVTNLDNTKVKVRHHDGMVQYYGKDAQTIQTIIGYLGGTLEIINLYDVINETNQNPWDKTSKIKNVAKRKREIVKELGVSILINSEMFTSNDSVFEQIYPHTMNNLHVITKKRKPVSVYGMIAIIAPPHILLVFCVPLCKYQNYFCPPFSWEI